MLLLGDWMKNEQSPQSRMTEGLQRNVLRLSTAGCTADVGKFRMQGKSGRPKRSQRPQAHRSCRRLRSFDLLSLQQNAPATQIRQLHLQGLYLPLADRQLQFHAIGREGFFYDQTAQFR